MLCFKNLETTGCVLWSSKRLDKQKYAKSTAHISKIINKAILALSYSYKEICFRKYFTLGKNVLSKKLKLYNRPRVDTKFGDAKFRMENYFRILQNFYFISWNFGEISQPYYAKFRKTKLKISRNKTKFHKIIGNSSRFKKKNIFCPI
jgi:hypothetical protein